MGLLNLLVLKKVNHDQTAKAKESPTHAPPIPPFIIPGAAAQALLPALLVYKFDIPTRHLLFCVLYPAYLIFANHFRFGNNIAVYIAPQGGQPKAAATMEVINPPLTPVSPPAPAAAPLALIAGGLYL